MMSWNHDDEEFVGFGRLVIFVWKHAILIITNERVNGADGGNRLFVGTNRTNWTWTFHSIDAYTQKSWEWADAHGSIDNQLDGIVGKLYHINLHNVVITPVPMTYLQFGMACKQWASGCIFKNTQCRSRKITAIHYPQELSLWTWQ